MKREDGCSAVVPSMPQQFASSALGDLVQCFMLSVAARKMAAQFGLVFRVMAYQRGGGGFNCYWQGHRFFAVDYHPYGRANEYGLHYHYGWNRSQAKKHRDIPVPRFW